MAFTRSYALLALTLMTFGLAIPQAAYSLGLSGGSITFRGSIISCTYLSPVGIITADPGNAAADPPVPAVWNEHADVVTCTKDGVEPLTFKLDVTYTLEGGLCFKDANAGVGQEWQLCGVKGDSNHPNKKGGSSGNVSQASCETTETADVLTYQGSCGGVQTVGTLQWIGAALGEGPGWTGCAPNATPEQCQQELGGFRVNRKGQVDLSLCETDFPDQSPAGLGAGEVLYYTETYAKNSGCKGDFVAGTGKRRMCTNGSFDPTSTNGPCEPIGTGRDALAYSGGIDPKDNTQVELFELSVDQWRPNSTLNTSCSLKDGDLSSGNVPTVIWDGPNFETDSIDAPDSVKAYVTGFPDNYAKLREVKQLSDPNTGKGLGFDFDACRADGYGVNNAICAAAALDPDAITPDGYVLLTIEGTKNGGVLTFTGNTSLVKLTGDCVWYQPPQYPSQ